MNDVSNSDLQKNALPAGGGAADVGENEISLLDLAVVMAKHKRLILGLPLAAGIVAVVVSLLMPNIYTGTVKMLPPQQGQSSAAAMLSQVAGGALAGLAGGTLGLKNPSDLYVGMLKSRTISDAIIERFKLKERYESEFWQDARMELQDNLAVGSGKDGFISIEFSDADPEFAAQVANAYVEELDRVMQSLAVTEAAQRRLFFERQLQQAKDNLATAEVEMKKMQEKSGLITLEGQGAAIIGAVAHLKAQIAVKEIQVGSMRQYATEQNPDVRLAQRELSEMRGQLSKLERSSVRGEGDVLIPTGKVPETGLEYVRRLRDVKYYETMFELLAKQFELAKLDESKDAVVIQVVDKALPPELKAKPKRALIVVLSTVAAGILAVLLVLIKDAIARSRQKPEHAQRFAEIRRALRDR